MKLASNGCFVGAWPDVFQIGCSLPLFLLPSNYLVVEIRMTEHALKEPQPERHQHFHPARSGDVAEIDDVLGVPAEPVGKKVNNFFFGHGVVATNEEIVIAGHE